VAIVSNGEEEGKGNELVQETVPLLRASKLNFVGNAEGKDIPWASPTSSSRMDSPAT